MLKDKSIECYADVCLVKPVLFYVKISSLVFAFIAATVWL